MIILGIETSCDETAIAMVKNGVEVLTSTIHSQIPIHVPYGGVVPEIASRNHIEHCLPVLKQTLAHCSVDDVDAIAVTEGPGLVGSLLVGIEFAKGLAYAWKKPLIAVNHLEAHLYAGWLRKHDKDDREEREDRDEKEGSLQDKDFPILCLIVSGGHTEIVWWKGHGKMESLATTRDDAAGEAFDKIAKLLGLSYPGGPAIQRLAESYRPTAKDRARHLFPIAMMKNGSPDFSFSGLKTAVQQKLSSLSSLSSFSSLSSPSSLSREAVAWHAQQAIVRALTEKIEGLLEERSPGAVLLTGGVAANRLLRDQLTGVCQTRKVKFVAPPIEWCTDNAAMIASAGYFKPCRTGDSPTSWSLSAQPALAL